MEGEDKTTPTLDYGRTPSRWSAWRELAWFAGAALLGLTCLYAAGWYFFAGPGYYWEANSLRSDLTSIKGVGVLRILGHDDITYEVHGAVVNFDNDPTRTVQVWATGAAHVSDLGGFTFSTATCGVGRVLRTSDGAKVPSWAYSVVLDLGPNGAVAASLPFAINDVADIHAHYDELIDLLASMAPYPAVHYRDLGNGRKSWLVVHPPGVKSSAYDVLPDSDDPPTRRPTDLLTLPAASSRPTGR